jgi:hypothetical protein
MHAKDLDYVRSKVENEGFHYCFVGYSNFKDVKDEEFHRLRENYLKAAKELRIYLNVESSNYQ